MTRPSIALRAILLIGSAALAACQDDAPSPIAPPSKASAAKSGTSGKPGSVEQVVFTGDRDGNVDIYIMNADGTNLRRVTTDSSRDEQAAFSPDNKRIVYVRSSMVRSLTSQDDELWPNGFRAGRCADARLLQLSERELRPPVRRIESGGRSSAAPYRLGG